MTGRSLWAGVLGRVGQCACLPWEDGEGLKQFLLWN